jgi:hypothetical protein
MLDFTSWIIGIHLDCSASCFINRFYMIDFFLWVCDWLFVDHNFFIYHMCDIIMLRYFIGNFVETYTYKLCDVFGLQPYKCMLFILFVFLVCLIMTQLLTLSLKCAYFYYVSCESHRFYVIFIIKLVRYRCSVSLFSNCFFF